MSFLETRLSEKIAYGFEAVPGYSTRITTLDNGNEYRNANWVKAKRRYRARFDLFTPAMFAEMLAAFHACKGALIGFRFKDFTDYTATAEALGIAPAGSTPVQLVKTYGFGVAATTRTIKKPVAGTVTVYQNGVAKAGTLDTTTGIFTPTTAWTGSAVLTWSGEFDVPVRFASDDFPATYEQFRFISADLQLIELFRAE